MYLFTETLKDTVIVALMVVQYYIIPGQDAYTGIKGTY